LAHVNNNLRKDKHTKRHSKRDIVEVDIEAQTDEETEKFGIS
jgi:putative aminopeptidase FrvX